MVKQLIPNNMEKNPKRIAETFLMAVRQGDHGQLAALLHPDVHWQQPGNNRFSGEKRSSTEVFGMAGGMAEVAGHTLRLDETTVLAVNGNRVACLLHWHAALPTGTVLDVDNIDVYTVENEKIVRVEVYSAGIEQEDEFWGR